MSLSPVRIPSLDSLEQLRALIQGVGKPLERERLKFSLLPLGLPRGVLIEISGPGKAEAAVRFLAENEKIRAAWVEDSLTIDPSAVLQRRVTLDRLLFVEAGRELAWALNQVLRSQLFGCVVASFQKTMDEKTLRRFQLAAEKSDIYFFLLTEKPSGAWPVAVQLQAVKNQVLHLRALKGKA